jgi:hypothetical protein
MGLASTAVEVEARAVFSRCSRDLDGVTGSNALGNPVIDFMLGPAVPVGT